MSRFMTKSYLWLTEHLTPLFITDKRLFSLWYISGKPTTVNIRINKINNTIVSLFQVSASWRNNTGWEALYCFSQKCLVYVLRTFSELCVYRNLIEDDLWPLKINILCIINLYVSFHWLEKYFVILLLLNFSSSLSEVTNLPRVMPAVGYYREERSENSIKWLRPFVTLSN